MNGKVTKVLLIAPAHNIRQEFEISHAERILSLRNSGWQLPDNSQYEFSKEYGIRNKRNKGTNNRQR